MRNNQWAEVLRLLGLGWFVVAALIGGLVLGLLLDGWIEVSPLFTLLGLALGLTVACFGIYRMIAPLLKTNRRGKENS